MAVGRKTGGGSRKGRPNKATAEIRDLAQQYTKEALTKLAEIMRNGASEQAQVAAANSLLDRGHGKPSQTVSATHRFETDPEAMTDAELANIASTGGAGAAGTPGGPSEPRQIH
jgi:hypothetical protein